MKKIVINCIQQNSEIDGLKCADKTKPENTIIDFGIVLGAKLLTENKGEQKDGGAKKEEDGTAADVLELVSGMQNIQTQIQAQELPSNPDAALKTISVPSGNNINAAEFEVGTGAVQQEKGGEQLNISASVPTDTNAPDINASEKENIPILKDSSAMQNPVLKDPTAPENSGTTMEKHTEKQPDIQKTMPKDMQKTDAAPTVPETSPYGTKDSNSVSIAGNIEKGVVQKNFNITAREIMHKAQSLSDGKSTTLKVKLYPEDLGEMEITLSMEHGKLSGKILVETKEVSQVFNDKLNELNQVLKENNINVAKFEVGIGAGQQQNGGEQQGQGQMQHRNVFVRYAAQPGEADEWTPNSEKTIKGVDILA